MSRALSPFERLRLVAEQKERERAELQPAGPVLASIASSLSTQTSSLSTQEPGTQSSSSSESTQASSSRQASAATASPADAKKDDREQLNLKLPKDFVERVRRWCFDNRMSQRDAVIEGLRLLMEQGGASRQASQGRNLPILDNDLDEDDRGVIHAYETVTGNAFGTPSDRKCLDEFRPLGPKCLMCGIAIGRNRAPKTKISSLRYFGEVFREVGNWSPDKIEKELRFQLNLLRHRGYKL